MVASVTTVHLSGEFDLGACDDLRDAVLGVIGAGHCDRVVIDVADVTFIDSETVRVELDGFYAAEAQGLSFRLANVHGLPRRVLDVMGLGELLRFKKSDD